MAASGLWYRASVVRLSGIFVHPIKSLRGVAVAAARAGVMGLRHDRRWMLVDETGRLVSQRDEPGLARLSVALGEGGTRVATPGGEALWVPERHEGLRVRVQVWSAEVGAVVHEEGSAFFSTHMRRPLRLVWLPDDEVRPAGGAARPGDRVSLADTAPYLILGQASLRALDERVRRLDLPITRFRPNLVVEGGQPHAEDEWATVRIGSVRFRGLGRCDRCVMTTIDPITGDKGVEPLRTLAGYRRWDGKVWFGAWFVSEDEGWLRVGDAVAADE